MKTTVEIPDELIREVKELVRTQGLTLRELVVDGLRSEVARRTDPSPRAEFSFPSGRSGGFVGGVREIVSASYGDRA